jgi:hypothetical protein
VTIEAGESTFHGTHLESSNNPQGRDGMVASNGVCGGGHPRGTHTDSSEPLLFTVPENWQPPSSLPKEDTQAVTTAHQATNTMEAQLEEFHICYIEEEFPEELLHMASQDVALSAGYNYSRATERDKDPRKQTR